MKTLKMFRPIFLIFIFSIPTVGWAPPDWIICPFDTAENVLGTEPPKGFTLVGIYKKNKEIERILKELDLKKTTDEWKKYFKFGTFRVTLVREYKNSEKGRRFIFVVYGRGTLECAPPKLLTV